MEWSEGDQRSAAPPVVYLYAEEIACAYGVLIWGSAAVDSDDEETA